MIYIKTFKNYDEFKQIFSVRECNNGNKQRQNKILLSCLKDRKFIHYLNNTDDDLAVRLAMHFWYVQDVGSLIPLGKMILNTYSAFKPAQGGCDFIPLDGWRMYSAVYCLDKHEGLCTDGSLGHIRYVRMDNGKVFKMKAGKFLHNILEEEYIYIPLSWQRFLEETFASEWLAHTKRLLDDIHLVVDEDFRSIYDSDICKGNFGSCMVDKDQHHFYKNAVKAKAASIRNGCGEILARCIIFTEVTDEKTGEVLRLAERQYSRNSDLSLQRILINMLIKDGYIDGYKQIGVDCHANDAYVDNNGDSMSHSRFSIRCYLDRGDTLSYQDSFVWYDEDSCTAYNYEPSSYTSELNTTNSRYREEENWSDYNNEYIPESDSVWVDNRNDYFRRDQCTYLRGEWYFDDDIKTCDECGEDFFKNDGYFSDLTDRWYCDEICLERGEMEYKETYWSYSSFDDSYYEYEDDVVTYNEYRGGRYRQETISKDSLESLLDDGRMFEYNGEYYYDVDEDRIPYGMNEEVA